MRPLRAWLGRSLPWILFLLLCAMFFLTCHDPTRVQVEGYNQAQRDIVDGVELGSPVRQVCWVLLGCWAAWSLWSYPRNRRLHFEGVLGPVALGFVLWAFLSCAWADDLALTSKRLVSFGLLCLVALAVVRRFSLRQMVAGAVICTLEYLVFNLAAELVHGTFHPLTAGYRFGGMQHPNSEGIELGPLVLSALAAAYVFPQHRRLCFGIMAAGSGFLLLTGSRTSLFATLLGVLVFAVAGSSPRRRAALLPGMGALVFAVALLAAAGAIPVVEHALLLGREDVISQDLTSFTGRTLLWEDVSPFMQQSPILGHGYNGFWTPDHIADISKQEKWGVPNSHSTYVDYMLTLGIVGASLYTFVLLAALWRGVQMCRIQPDPSLALVCGVLVFSIVDGLTESGMVEGELGTMLCAVAVVWLASVQLGQIRDLRTAQRGQSRECVA
jgi:O-antigen ligase